MQPSIRYAVGILALAATLLPASAIAKCQGTFLRDSQGYLTSEGGAEPSADQRKKGAKGVFLYFDTMDGERFYRLADGHEHKAASVKLEAGCRLPKLRPGGKY
jgi:hypothetical protein